MQELTKLIIIALHKTMNDDSYINKYGKEIYKYQYENRLEQILKLDKWIWKEYKSFIDEENINYEWHQLTHPEEKKKETDQKTNINFSNNEQVIAWIIDDKETYDTETKTYIPF